MNSFMKKKECECMDENNLNAKNFKKKGVLLGGIILIALLVIGAVAAYYFTPVKPKKVFTTILDKVYESNKSKQKDLDSITGKMNLKTDLHSNDNSTENILEILNDLEIRYEYGMDFKEKKIYVLLDTFYKEKELLNATAQLQEENAYINLKDIYDKTLQVPMEGLEEMLSMVNQKDYDTILKHLKNALDKALKEKYFSKENASITLNGKNVKVTKNNLLLNEENLSEILDVLKQELNNDEFLESFARITDQSREDVKDMLNEIDSRNVTLDQPITISVYTIGRDFKGIELTNGTDTFSILKDTDTKYTYEIKTNNTSYKGNFELTKKENDLHLKIAFDTKELTGSIVFDFNYKENEKLPIFDTSNSISLYSLTEEEQAKIIENFQKKEGIALLMQTILNSNMLNFSL